MSDFDERKILRRLNEIAQIKPAADATQRAMDKVRQQVADDTGLDEESDLDLEHKLGHKLFTIKRAILAVAAVIVVALVITVGLMLKSGDKSKGSETAKTVLSDKTGIRTDEGTVESARSPVEVEAFLEMIEEVFAAGDISEAVTLITQASDEQRDAAMGLLARLMKERAARIAAAADEITDRPTETPDELITDEEQDAKQKSSLTSDTTTAPKDDTAIAEEGTGVFSGIVIDEDGEPVAGATVFVKGQHDWDRHIPNGQAVTDKEGVFVVKIAPDKLPFNMPVSVWSHIEGQEGRMAWTLLDHEERKKDGRKNLSGGQIPGESGEIKFDRSARRCEGATGIVLQMEKAGRIFGTVRDTLDNPVEGANVRTLFYLNLESGIEYRTYDLWNYNTTTNKDGYYEVDNLPQLWDRTGWRLKVSADAHSAKFEDFTSYGPLDEKRVDVELLLVGITITGTVIDNYGNPLANRDMSAKPDSSYGYVIPSFSSTNSKGRFWLERCVIAERLIVEARLSHNTYHRDTEEYKNFVYYPDVSIEIFIEEDKFEYEVELVATLPEITIEVEVVDPNNNPVPYFPVTVTGSGVTFTGVGITDQWRIDKNFIQRTDINGQCTFTEVPDADHLVVLLDHNFKVPTDSELEPNEKELIEKLTAYYTETGILKKRIRIPILVVSGQKNYKVQARIPLRLNQDSPLGTEQNP